MACEGSSDLYERLLSGTGPGMDAILPVLRVCAAHSTLSLLTFTDAPAAESDEIVTRSRRSSLSELDILCKQRTHVDKGRG